MSESDDAKRRAALFEQEKQRMEAAEKEKRLLHDRTVGGPMVPRPSKDFVEKCTGPLKSQAQIEREASDRADRLMKDGAQPNKKSEPDKSPTKAAEPGKDQQAEKPTKSSYWDIEKDPAAQRKIRDEFNERAKARTQERDR